MKTKTLTIKTNTRKVCAMLGVVLLFAFVASCEKKDTGTTSEPYVATPSSLDNLNAPEDFTWKTTQVVNFSFLADAGQEIYSKISVYTENPEEGGQVIMCGGSNGTIPFDNSFQMPAYMSEIFVKCEFVSGTVVSKEFVLGDEPLQYTFTDDKLKMKSAEIVLADSDGDGIDDVIDDYPNDINAAWRSRNDYTWVFEDNWPYKGDYDFNDLVTRERVFYITNASNKLYYVKIFFKVDAAGASFNNGLGVVLPGIETADLGGVKVTQTTKKFLPGNSTAIPIDMSLSDEDWEDGHSGEVVIIAIENVDDVLNRVTSGWAFNTVKADPKGDADIVEVDIRFDTPITSNLLVESAFGNNCFLIKDQNRGAEVHLKFEYPTDLADMSLFGTADDGSIPGTLHYFTKETYLPWALVFAGTNFRYPQEYTSILDAYPRFEEFANSGGEDWPQWYAVWFAGADVQEALLFE